MCTHCLNEKIESILNMICRKVILKELHLRSSEDQNAKIISNYYAVLVIVMVIGNKVKERELIEE